MKILLAADGSDFTRASLDLLDRMTFPPGSELTVVTVAPALESAEVNEAAEVEALRESARTHAHEVLEACRARTSEWDLDFTGTIRTGSVADEIIEGCAELESDLVVVGTHGLGGIGRFLLGSVSHEVVHAAPCSVLLIRCAPEAKDEAGPDADPAAPLRVLVAIDDSESAGVVIAQLESVLPKDRCALHLMTVLELVTAYRMDIWQRLSASYQRQRAAAEQQIRDARATLEPMATSVETEIVEARNAAEAILDKADEIGAEVIVVGATGKSRVERLLLGSVSSRVVSHAACSVLICR